MPPYVIVPMQDEQTYGRWVNLVLPLDFLALPKEYEWKWNMMRTDAYNNKGESLRRFMGLDTQPCITFHEDDVPVVDFVVYLERDNIASLMEKKCSMQEECSMVC